MDKEINKLGTTSEGVEITPEIIDAGFDVYMDWGDETEPVTVLVADIFRTMMASRAHSD